MDEILKFFLWLVGGAAFCYLFYIRTRHEMDKRKREMFIQEISELPEKEFEGAMELMESRILEDEDILKAMDVLCLKEEIKQRRKDKNEKR